MGRGPEKDKLSNKIIVEKKEVMDFKQFDHVLEYGLLRRQPTVVSIEPILSQSC